MNKYQQILEYHGYERQLLKLIEESNELGASIARFLGEETRERDDIVSEMADVLVLIRQMAIIFGENEIEKEVEFKLDRVLERINGNKKGNFRLARAILREDKE